MMAFIVFYLLATMSHFSIQKAYLPMKCFVIKEISQKQFSTFQSSSGFYRHNRRRGFSILSVMHESFHHSAKEDG